ncbi:carbon starvation protein A [Nibricoccus aquaticus]|uniref:Carbon starvation protein A n=1 Tax=Nibricoccus aquaticus TaxID=2576891 RepID=A0A290Q6K3_9BACT|nr:carbon starvation CstA family protein [Nibricoccus aquaticus]ATC63897.1 carbon starvation protein A [Nibricoccus aquaticus]
MSSSSTKKWLRVLGWSAVVAAGVVSLGTVAWSRGEPVNALWVVIASVCVFTVAYRFHSAWLMAKVLTVDELRATPAMVKEDGRDFVRTNRWVVFGHHFAAIAGPGPLVGPVLAAQFGYLPGLLWILIGATLGGAVHDAVILFCSTRRGGKSLGQMIRDEIGPFAGVLALVSIIGIMIILIAVLGLVVVKALAESPWGLFTIAATMPIAVLMGCALRYWVPGRVGLVSVFGFIGLMLAVWGGQFLHGTALEAKLTLSGTSLAWWIIGYGLLASVLPVWLLLAPRDYLSTFLKIGAVAVLGVAILILAPTLKMPAVTAFIDGSGPVVAGPVFPFCFITIACAAVSGFHALISSGTTPKLITRESDIRIVGYGAMVTEMLVGVMALIAACAMQPGEYFAINLKGASDAAVVAKVTALGYPVTEAEMSALAASVGEKNMIGRTGGAPTFAVGMAQMFAGVMGKHLLPLWYHFAIMFEALFILTTVDAGTRVGRFLVQDLLGLVWKPLGRTNSRWGNWIASAVFVAAWGWFLYQGVIDPLGGINSLWPIFGVANQLLAVLALALGTTVLIKMGRRRYLWVTLLPFAWLLAVTMTAGWMKIFSADPRVGFLSAADGLKKQIAGGGSVTDVARWEHLLTNNYVNTAVTGTFLVLVLLVVAVSVREWWKLLSGRRVGQLREEPYVTVNVAEGRS